VGDCIMMGCDLHDESVQLVFAVDRDEPRKRSFRNTASGWQAMIGMLKASSIEQPRARVVSAYEACSQGFGLHD
jgi:hypothetical protein